MFPLSLLQSSHSPLCPCSEPALTLWPATCLIYSQLEDDMLSLRKEMERRAQRVSQACQLLAQDMDMRRRAAQSTHSAGTEITSPRTGKEGKGNFELTLDVRPFSPEELTVTTEGRRLIVTGKRDKKQDSETDGYFHEYREWRREAELPEDVIPEAVLCSLSKDGQLHFQAPRLALPAAEGRPVPITVTQTPGKGQAVPPVTQSSQGMGDSDTGAISS
ncbi:heat shock protein 30C-like [Pseudophryne corroboree]|uniref:heat shock protein 30C-like n=1 Tax=Pseudophryne corroboree TaxID=495146 RepID=UPI00308219CD